MDFPKNNLGLKRGTILKSTYTDDEERGLEIDHEFAIGFDGKFIRCGGFTWSIERLSEEISVHKIWKIVGHMDLSDPKTERTFRRDIEFRLENTA